MSARVAVVTVVGVALCSLAVAMAQGPGDTGDVRFAITSVQLDYGPARLPLKQDHIVVRKPDGSEETMPIVLLERHYMCDKYRVPGDPGSANSVRTQSVELLGVGQDGVLTWSRCADNVAMGMFGVVRANDGKNYLTWTEGWFIRFEELGKPTDRLVSVVNYAAGMRDPVRADRRVYTRNLFEASEEKYLGGTPFFVGLGVHSIEFAADGRIVLKVRAAPPHEDKQFTLVFDGKEWRRQE